MIDKNQDRLPALDGIRGISAWFVVAAHLGLLPRAFGALGVSMFFTLSGFLITWLMLRESAYTGTVSLRKFYMRRTLRIFPAFYVYALVAGALLVLAGRPAWKHLAAVAVYMGDYYSALYPTTPMLGIAWSLGIEEKFYLLWPSVFVRMRDRLPSLLNGAAAVIVACTVYRAVLWFGLGVSADYPRYAFEARLDGLAIGCALALAVYMGRDRWLRILTGHPLLPVAYALAAVGITAGTDRFGPKFDYAGGITLIAILCGLTLVGAVRYAPRLLDSRLMRYFGKTSYSTYLYHIVAIFIVQTWFANLRWSVQLGFAIALTLVLSHLSMTVVEERFLRLKRRFQVSEHERAGAAAH